MKQNIKRLIAPSTAGRLDGARQGALPKRMLLHRLSVVLVTLLLTMTAQTAWADSYPEYITDIIVVGGSESEVNSAKSAHGDYTFISEDLNDGAGGDYIYLGYKKGSRASTNGGYITDIIVIDAQGTNPPSTVTYGGRSYTRCAYDGGSNFESVKGNLNSNCGNGWNLYLYYTKQEYNSTKRAVSSITVNSTKSGAINCYYTNGNSQESEIDLNRGISGSKDIYMHISTTTKTNRPSSDPVMASGLVYNGSAQQLLTISNSNTGTMMYRVGTSGSFSASLPTATAAGTYTVYYYAASDGYGNQSATISHTVTISKSNNSGVTISCADVVEGNAPQPSLGGTNLSTGAITYEYSTSQSGTYSTTVPTTAGTYWVKATIAADGNYNEYTTPAVSFKMIPDWALHNSGNSKADAYVISSPQDLDLLAQRVNAGNVYKDKYFRLGGNIIYSHDSEWDNTSSTENNYTPIGGIYNSEDRFFSGDFDGAGHTISGIRIYRSGIAYADQFQGVFGYTSWDANIHGLRLADARITGYDHTGGIVGYNYRGTVTDCHVANDVCIHAFQTNAWYHGGIAGRNKGTVANSTSAATLTIPSGDNDGWYYGAIAGYHHGGTLRDNLAIGATVPAASSNTHGAIAGYNNGGTLQRNYYTACKVASENVTPTGVGCQNADVTTNDGALPALRDNADNTNAIALLAALAQTDADRPVLPLDLGWGEGQFSLQLAGRTLTKDGNWNTLCLPFGVDDFSGTPLEGATVKELDATNSNLAADGTLTLKFTEAASIEAGKPYIVKWETTGDNISNPVFEGVTIAATTPTADPFANNATTGDCQFVGQYSPFTIGDTSNGTFDGDLNEIILMGSGSKLGYSQNARTLKSFRAHFYVPANGSTANVRAFVLDFGDGDNTTGIISINADNSAASADGWYDLNGRRLNGQPTQKGVYIVNGKKVVIK